MVGGRLCTRAHAHACFVYSCVLHVGGVLFPALNYCSLWKKLCMSKHEVQVMLKLSPNTSIALEPIHIFQIRVLVELPVLTFSAWEDCMKKDF